MASVTSLPELITGVSSMSFACAPDIAVGDVLGSCVFNMLIISMLDANNKIMPISTRAHQGNILSAAFGILLLAIVTISLHIGKPITPLGWIGPYSRTCLSCSKETAFSGVGFNRYCPDLCNEYASSVCPEIADDRIRRNRVTLNRVCV
jgi:hypothetical protein